MGKNMQFDMECKFVGDSYAGGFSNGLTMVGSSREKFRLQTLMPANTAEGNAAGEKALAENLQKADQVAEESTLQEGTKVYISEDGIQVTVLRQKDGDCIRVITTIENGSDKPVTMEMLTSFVLKNVEADAIYRLQSFWSAEGKIRRETIDDLHLEPSWNRCGLRIEKFGNVGSMPVRKYFPFLALENSKTGKFIGIQLYCPSSWQMEIICKEGDFLTVTGGLADRDFGQWMKTLQPGESFTAPEAVIAEGDSVLQVCDRLVKAQHPAISEQDPGMDIVFNEYCTTWGNPSFENVKKICDHIADKGIKFLVIDSGWYGKDTWWNSIGDWIVNEDKFPGGMKPIADYVRSKGMIPGLWFEIESLAHESEYYNKKEYLVCKDGFPLTVGGRRFWNMENPDVVELLSRKIIDQLKNSGFGYLKVDYNDSLGMGVDGAESLGEGLRRQVLATQSFFAKIREEIPGIVIENCSSGGHRLEPSMMALASQASFSDAHETTAIPLIAANMHRVIPPKQSQIWAVMRETDSDERIYYSIINTFFGRMCLSGDIYSLSKHQWELIQEGMEFYKKASEIIQKGETKCINVTSVSENRSYNNPQGQQVVCREYQGKGLCILHRFANSQVEIPAELKGRKILASYGKAEGDFSARAWLYES